MLLEELVQEWLRSDRNKESRKEIKDLWDIRNVDELEKRMRPRIEFGTAGLRGKMEAGWARMNDLIVLQTTQGLCAYVLAKVADAKNRGVVVGYDHRHNSERWAQLVAMVFITRGLKTYLLQGLVHTPLVPFSVKHLEAACGIMITASHNPKQDNGYKVYWENAVQIINPHDEGISEAIKANLELIELDANSLASTLLVDKTREMKDAYFNSLSELITHRSINEKCSVKFVNTSMHGVGDSFVREAFARFGFTPYIPVDSQQQPDPEFPTVRRPNPEENGALVLFQVNSRIYVFTDRQDLAIDTANKEGASYILAQDPDADRFAAAEKSVDGTWTMFTGDQIGTLFAAWILDIYRSSGKPIDKLAMVASTVSSRMIEAMSVAEGFVFRDCLTGFKYIGNTALDLVAEGFEVPFGYEEAIGYMIGSKIRDKDGVSATAFFSQLVAALHAQRKTATSFLDELYDRYGYFKTSNSYFICHDPSTIDIIFKHLRYYKDSSLTYPEEIGGLRVTRVVDLTVGYDSGNPPSFKPRLPLSSGHMIQFRAENEDQLYVVLTIRTSGTEPKIKYYLEGNSRDRQAVVALLPRIVEELGGVWLEAKKHRLGSP